VRLGPGGCPLEQRGCSEQEISGLREGEVGQLAFDQVRVEPAGPDVLVTEEKPEVFDIGRHAEHQGVGERPVEPGQRLLPVFSPRDDFAGAWGRNVTR
jgi:hypothetical protein